MTTIPQRETAKIYQFPTRGREAIEAAAKLAREFDAAKTVITGSWYHEEAVLEDADRAGKH